MNGKLVLTALLGLFFSLNVLAAPVEDDQQAVNTRIAIPVSNSVTLHVGNLPAGNPLSIFPNQDLLTQWMPFFSYMPELPGFGFGVEVNAKEKPPQFDAQGNLITPAPRTRRPRH